jgi:hypothetical protein
VSLALRGVTHTSLNMQNRRFERSQPTSHAAHVQSLMMGIGIAQLPSDG